MIRAVMFDYYGVISQDPLQGWRIEHQLSDEQWQQVQDICHQSDAGQLELNDFYRQLARISGQIPGQIESQLGDFILLNHDLLEIIKHLRHRGLLTGVISNSGPTLRQTMHLNASMPLFDHLILSSEVGLLKPDPQFFISAVTSMKLEPYQVAFFDDRQKNIDGARQAGLVADQFISAADCRATLVRLQLLPAHHFDF